ncbi:MAG: VWA domain-containing protein [Candidatus Brocadiia bacterium]
MWPLRVLHPVALALIPAIAGLAFWRRGLRRACTLAALVGLALAAARPQWATERRRAARVYALDVSGSTFADVPAALDAIRRSAADLAPADTVGVLVFAATPAFLLPPAEARLLPPQLDPSGPLPHRAATDLAGAIAAAARQLDARASDAQVVLLTDGRETRGDARAEAALAASRGIRIFVLPTGPGKVTDARVAALRVPATVRPGEAFRLVVELVATADLEVPLTIERGNSRIRRTADLAGGVPRRLALAQRLEEPGPHQFLARLDLADRCLENNRAVAVVRVEGPTRALVLADRGPSPVAAVLEQAEGIEVRQQEPRAEPLDADDLDAADCVVLDDLPAEALGQEARTALRRWVRDRAGGLIVFGGPHSYGPGGYAGSPVEEALPVLCSRPKAMAVVVALDKSGSMSERAAGRSKMAFAREAVLEALGELRPDDRFALLVFDRRPEVLLPLGPPPSPDRLAALLREVEPHGPTELAAALDAALELAARAAAQIRHVVLVSDGQTAELDVGGIRRRYEDAEVFLSALMTGRDPEAVARLRALGGERFHLVTDVAALPREFLRALRQVAYQEFVREGTFAVAAGPRAEVAAGVEVAGPLGGYVRAVAKPTAATEWATAEERDPVLARWRFGLGRAVAFTSTVGTRWDRALWAEGGASRLCRQAVRWAARPARTPGFEAQYAESHEAVRLTVRVEREGELVDHLDLSARVAPPAGDAFGISLPQTAPGEYEGEWPAPVQGIYHVTVVDGQGRPCLAMSVAKNTAREWTGFGADRAALADIARHGGGRMLDSLDELADVEARRAAGYVDLDWALVALALLLFTADVALLVLRSRRTSL